MTFNRNLHLTCECGNDSLFLWDTANQEIICLKCGLVIIKGREEILYEQLLRSGSAWAGKNLHLSWRN
jgi:transcription initiation factor TFIIIB Brf1 subunit/transcription initiation factor TFIIB